MAKNHGTCTWIFHAGKFLDKHFLINNGNFRQHASKDLTKHPCKIKTFVQYYNQFIEMILIFLFVCFSAIYLPQKLFSADIIGRSVFSGNAFLPNSSTTSYARTVEYIFFRQNSIEPGVYHPKGNLLRCSPGPSPARDKTRGKILLRMPCAHTCHLVRTPCAQGCTVVRMPFFTWEKF